MDHHTRSFPTDSQQPPGTGDRDPPDFLEFLAEADLLPLTTYLQLQNRELDGKASESDTLISLGLIGPTRLAQLQAEHLAEGYIDLTLFPPSPDLLKNLGPATALQRLPRATLQTLLLGQNRPCDIACHHADAAPYQA